MPSLFSSPSSYVLVIEAAIAKTYGMIHLKFDGGSSGPDIVLGPAPWFRVAGNFIRQGPHGAIVGSFRNHYWELQSRRLVRYFCDERYHILFEDAVGDVGERLGPFAKLWVEDGVLHAEDFLKAKFHEQTQVWHCYESDTYWPVMVIEAV
jgi:hypothetical protein